MGSHNDSLFEHFMKDNEDRNKFYEGDRIDFFNIYSIWS